VQQAAVDWSNSGQCWSNSGQTLVNAGQPMLEVIWLSAVTRGSSSNTVCCAVVAAAADWVWKQQLRVYVD
jgi:hypothetical protein